MTSGYSPIGAMIASDRIVEPFLHGDTSFAHGYTFGGHPVSAAVALANLDIFEREKLNDARAGERPVAFRRTLEKLTDLPIVGDVRGDGYFFGIEMVKDKSTRETFDDDESERLLRGFLSRAFSTPGCTAVPTTAATRSSSSHPRSSATSPTSTRWSRSCARC